MDPRCKACIVRNYDRLLARFPVPVTREREFSDFFNTILNNSSGRPGPEIQRELQTKLREITGIEDPYLEEKQLSNRQATKLYEEWRPKVLEAVQPFNLALRLSIAGNIMDYGANHQFDIRKTIEEVINADFAIDHSSRLRERIRVAKKILYLGDNAGEIVFDKLFIEIFMHPNVTYVVKGGPAINDATMEDAETVGMNLVADVISNGYDAPSTILSQSAPEFQSLFANADLIISKGQGNYEGLLAEKDSRIFFLLMVKCDLIAEKIGVGKGSFIVMQNGKN